MLPASFEPYSSKEGGEPLPRTRAFTARQSHPFPPPPLPYHARVSSSFFRTTLYPPPPSPASLHKGVSYAAAATAPPSPPTRGSLFPRGDGALIAGSQSGTSIVASKERFHASNNRPPSLIPLPLSLSLSLSQRQPLFARLKAVPRSHRRAGGRDIASVASVKLRIGGYCYSRDYTIVDMLCGKFFVKEKF